MKMLSAYSNRVISCGVDADILKTMDFIILEVLRSENENDDSNQTESTKIYLEEYMKYSNSNKSVTHIEEAEIQRSMDFIIETVLRFENSERKIENSNDLINEFKSDSGQVLMKRSQVLLEIKDDIRGNEESFKCDNDLNFDSEEAQDHVSIITESRLEKITNISNDIVNICYEASDFMNRKELFVKALGLASCVNNTCSLSCRDDTVNHSRTSHTDFPNVSRIKNTESVHFNSPIAEVYEYTVSQTSEAYSTQPLSDEDINHDKDYSQDIIKCEENDTTPLDQADEADVQESFAKEELPVFDSLIENHKEEQYEQNLKQQHELKSANLSLTGEPGSPTTPCNLKDLCTLVCDRLMKIKEVNCEKNITHEDKLQIYHNDKTDFTQDIYKVNGSNLDLTDLPNDITSKEITNEHEKDNTCKDASKECNYEYRTGLMTPGGDAYTTVIQTQYLLAEPLQQIVINEIETKNHIKCKSETSENQLNCNNLVGKELEELQNVMETKLYEPFGHIVQGKEFFSKEPTCCPKLLASPDLFLDNYDSYTINSSEDMTNNEEDSKKILSESQDACKAGSLEVKCVTNKHEQYIGIDKQVQDESTETKFDGEILEESNHNEEDIKMKNNSKVDNDVLVVKSTNQNIDVEATIVDKLATDETVELESKLYGEVQVAQSQIHDENLEVDKQIDEKMENQNKNKISEESVESKFGNRGYGTKNETKAENEIREEDMAVKLGYYCQTANETCTSLFQTENQSKNIPKNGNCADKDEISNDIIEYKAERSQERSLVLSANRKRKLFHSKVEINHSPSKVIKLNHNPTCSSMELKQPVALRALAKQTIDKSEELTLWCTEDMKIFDSRSFVESQSADRVYVVQNLVGSEQANTTRDNDLNKTSVIYSKTDENLDKPMKDQTEKIETIQDTGKGTEFQGFISATEHLSQSSQGSSTGFVFHPVLQGENTNGTNGSQNSVKGVMVIHECYDAAGEAFEDSHSNTEYIVHPEKEHCTRVDLSDLDSYIDKSIDQMVPGEGVNLTDYNDHGGETDFQASADQIPLYTCDVDLYCETDKQVCNQGEKIANQCGPTKRGEFKWKYAPSVDLESNATTSSDLDLEHQVVRIIPLKTCGKPIRLGLSKKQSLVHLHKINQNNP